MKPYNKKITIAFVVAGVVIVVALAIGLLIYGIYYKTNDSCFVRGIASAFNIPAGRVGKYQVSYIRFLKTRDAVKQFVNSEAGQQVKAQMPPENVLDKNVLERLMRQEMIQEIADQKKISVSDDDVRAVFADVVRAAASSTTPDVAQYLSKNYGWNEEDFRQEVLKPALLEQKVGVELAKEKQGDNNALEAALTERNTKPDVIEYLKF